MKKRIIIEEINKTKNFIKANKCAMHTSFTEFFWFIICICICKMIGKFYSLH